MCCISDGSTSIVAIPNDSSLSGGTSTVAASVTRKEAYVN